MCEVLLPKSWPHRIHCRAIPYRISFNVTHDNANRFINYGYLVNRNSHTMNKLWGHSTDNIDKFKACVYL